MHPVRKSLAGGYHFKRMAVGAGYERFRDAPNKNEHSHVGDAFGYLMLGAGEVRSITRNSQFSKQFKQLSSARWRRGNAPGAGAVHVNY
jgi:hypothetical protein